MGTVFLLEIFWCVICVIACVCLLLVKNWANVSWRYLCNCVYVSMRLCVCVSVLLVKNVDSVSWRYFCVSFV